RKNRLQFRLETTLKIGDFEKEYTRGSFDFVYMNPYYILKSTPSNEYIPLVRDKAPLRGVLVVCKDSALRSPAGLDGKVVAFPSPNALGASLLMRADLDRVFHVAVKPLYVKTHSSVYLHVATGLAAAGGGVEKSLREQPPEIRDSLRILYTTREMPSHPVAAHPRVAKEVREKVRQAFLEMGKSPEGRELLSKIPVRQMIPTSIEDYRPMFGWGLESYWDASWEGE
ncbi:MAG: phosphate/phosphite/phosphonate ABC transporter substrate-binding protein, partial [Nitrospiraceae bacterium]|nr:phosphate/phosphite/phosphonate ABC transporter substrate-binding protein [Nitrospiraceae bacterium]